MSYSIRIITLLVSVFLLLPRSFYQPISAGIDGSWVIALHIAFERGFVFGRDLLFTFGPLGILATRLPIGEGIRGLLFAFDIFFYLNLINLFWFAVTGRNLYFRCAVLLLFAFVHSQAMYFLDPPFFLLLFCFFWVCRSQEKDSDLYFAFALANAIISFFMKVHFGFLSFAILFIATIVHGAHKKTYRHVFRLAIAGICFFLFAELLNVSLPGYIASARHFTGSYPDAMWLTSNSFRRVTNCSTAMLVFAVLLQIFGAFASYKRPDELLRILGLMTITGLLWKQAIVRADAHIWIFPELTPIVLGLGAVLSSRQIRKISITGSLLALGILFYANPHRYFVAALESKVEDMKRTSAQFFYQPVNEVPAAVPKEAELPAQMLATIGNQTVDIMPSELSSLWYYHLNYRPRGVLQSYAAYDSFLDEFGARTLRSAEAPRFLLYRYSCIDNRYCLFDEPRTKREMMEEYDLRSVDGDLLLFQKRNIPSSMEEVIVSSGSARLGEPLNIPEADGVLLFRTSVDYSSQGEMRRLLFRPSGLKVVLLPESGKQLKHRAVLPLLEDGVPINYRVLSAADAANFFSGRFDELTRFQSVELDSDVREDFQPTYFYEFVRQRFSAAPISSLPKELTRRKVSAPPPEESDGERNSGGQKKAGW